MVEWTKGHFEEVARVVKEQSAKQIKNAEREDEAKIPFSILNLEICSEFAKDFEKENPRFDKDRFIKACVVKN